MATNVFVYGFVVFVTKLAKREEREGNPLGFLDRPLTDYTMNYKR